MNILITNISAFPYKIDEFQYEIQIDNCEVETVNAKHTNESILKCLSQLRDVKRDGGINRIIALVSQKTIIARDERFDNLTAFEYFKRQASLAFGFDPEIVEVKIETEDQRERDLYLVIQEICSNISDEDVVYIDAAGGKRTTTNVIQLVTKILEYKGIRNPLTLYSDIQNNPKFITDTKAFEQLTDLADAFNEFMTSGKSNLLQECVSLADSSEQYKALVTAMCEFSDKIKLGKVDDLEDTIMKLKNGIEQCSEYRGDNIESVIVNQFLPIIKHRFLGEKDTDKVDYIKLVEWCLENDLLQQALTIFTEKIPISIFEKKIICYEGDIEEAKKSHLDNVKKSPLLAHDWETAMLYSEIMTTKDLDGDKALVQEFITCLKERSCSSNIKVNEILENVRRFRINESANGNTAKILKVFCNERGLTSETSMINTICNNHQIVVKLLELKSEEKHDSNTLVDKFSFVESLKGKKFNSKGKFTFASCCPNVMYGYLYVKSVRNTVNHASSEEKLNEEQKKVLTEIGYDFTMYDFKTVKKNVSKALRDIKNANIEDFKCVLDRTSKKENVEQIITVIPTIGVKVVGKIDLDTFQRK